MKIRLKELFVAGLAVFALLIPDCQNYDFSEMIISAEVADEEQIPEEMELVSENDKLAFYLNQDEELLAVKNKATNYIWWSSPVNIDEDEEATKTMKKEIKSSMVITYGEPGNRSTSVQRSADKGKVNFEKIENGVRAVYKFSSVKITIPVEYVLNDEYLSATVKISDIEEGNNSDSDGQILTALSLLSSFGAGGSDEEGYFVIPDGSGALINFNNGKTYLKSYYSKVYGSDITAVPDTKPAVTQQVYMPVFGIVKGENAMMAIVHSGDGNVAISASVSGQSKSSYNLCSFQFTLRATDTYNMSGEANALTVFEKNGIKNEDIEVRYYAINGDSREASYVDVAKAYRRYLENEQGIEKKPTQSSLYIDFYGGVEKQKSFMGFPVTVKNPITTFDEAENMLSQLKSAGVKNIVASYNNWTDAEISGKVDKKAKASAVLGGNSGFKKLMEYAESNNIQLYPVTNNKTFVSGNGYTEFRDTAIRVSGSFARLVTYNMAYGVRSSLHNPLSLLSPSVFGELYGDITESYKSLGTGRISTGELTTVLYGDYGKKNISRDMAKNTIKKSLSELDSEVGSVLARNANAYAFPYTDHITNVPLTSSNYDIFDENVPFYQIVMHGLIPYSTEAVNGSADAGKLILMAIATGSNLHYDMIHADTSELKDTNLDKYFYANFDSWSDSAINAYRLVSEIADGLSDKQITGYRQEDNDIFTTYEDGTEIHVNLESGTVTVDGGKKYKLADYADEGKGGF